MFCAKCRRFWSETIARAQIPDIITTCKDVQWSSYETVLHSSLRELKFTSDSHCILCRIIYHTPTEYEHCRLLQKPDEPIDVVLEIDPTKGPHPVLSVTFQEALSGSVRVAKRMVAACGGLLDDNELVATLRRSVELTNDSTGSDGALHLATSWLKDCTLNHEQCRLADVHRRARFVPTRLLDVSNDVVRLVETKASITASMDRRYVALSHCWGKILIVRTLMENYQNHLSRIEWAELSQTFKDAVHATRKLGFRYLWIDSLCIIQDDDNDWVAEAETMCDVYQHAAVTIAAAHAAGGDVGCFKERDGLLQMPMVVDVPQSRKPDLPARIAFTSYGRGEGLSGPEPPLYGRAWVLQEQILSPRMLIFDGSQLRWECLTVHASERSHKGGMSRHVGHQKAIRKGIMDAISFFGSSEVEDSDFVARTQHQYWCYLIMDYTHRGMTQAKDRLVALAGTAQALGRHTESEYLAGLWSRLLWAGMLWSIPHSREYVPTTMNAFNLEKNKQIRHAKPLAPSWSWASVTVPVVYVSSTTFDLGPVCDILSATTAGTAAVQTGCVKIRGHIRKGYVNAIYPFAIQEAITRHRSHMMTQKPDGKKDFINFKGRAFTPNDYLLFSTTRPKMPRVWGSDFHPTLHLTRSGDWRLVRGTFRPDQIISPKQEITFLAIAQQQIGHSSSSALSTHEPNDPLRVYTIALIPADGYGENTGRYKRVGYAMWDECAWYGYMCGNKKRLGANVERAGRWTKDNGWEVNNSTFDTLRWWMKWDDLEFYKKDKTCRHEHSHGVDALPSLEKYHKDVGIEERVVSIV